jgi:hypothetical protein
MTSTSLADLRQSLTGAVTGPADWSELGVGGECVREPACAERLRSSLPAPLQKPLAVVIRDNKKGP